MRRLQILYVHVCTTEISSISRTTCCYYLKNVQPLSERELNGPGFNYVVKYKLLNSPGRPQTITIDDPDRSEVVIHDREIFRQYEISVQSSNDEGLCAERAVPRIGHSGEGSKQASLVVSLCNFYLYLPRDAMKGRPCRHDHHRHHHH